jgi:5-methyltetrahydropteroyltriglutamate--homocysteine methyltransferase
MPLKSDNPRADHVGSLVRPPYLAAAFKSTQRNEAEFEQMKDHAVEIVVRQQEAIGLPVVNDGEFRRRSWQGGLMDALGGFDAKPGPFTFRNEAGVSDMALASFITRKLVRGKGITTDEFAKLKALTTRTAKITLPSPSTFHFGLFDECVSKDAYPDIDAFYTDIVAIYRLEIAELAALGCTRIQIDEVSLPSLCDPAMRAIVTQNGEEPDRLVSLYISLHQAILANPPAGVTFGMHMCRGNRADLFWAEGSYDLIAGRAFNEIPVDYFLLEFDTPRAGGFGPLRTVPAGKIAYLGLISTKIPAVEQREALVRRIEEAAKVTPLDRLGICPQCGFSSTLGSDKAKVPVTEDGQWAKLRTMLNVADEVWGKSAN